MPNKRSKKTVAVLIDEENVSVDALSWLFGQLASLGEVTVKRAYAKWATGTLKKRQGTLQSLGIDAINVVEGSQRGKNSSDIRLAIDATDLLHEENLDVFVIVSGDSDFRPVVDRIRRSGKSVYGAGRTKVASKTLVDTYDKYFDLDSSSVVPATSKIAGTTGVPKPVASSSTTSQTKDNALEQLIARAIKDVQASGEPATGSRLHQRIKKLDAKFAVRKHGFSTFRKLLESLPSVTITPGKKGDMTVRLKNSKASKGGVTPRSDADAVGEKIHQAWRSLAKTNNDHKEIAAPSAASAAAKALGAAKLSTAEHKTLARLIRAHSVLSRNWRQEGNKIISK